MDKVISTVLMTVASVICVVVVINAVYPAITTSSGAMTSATSIMNERIRSQIEIVHAAGELLGNGTWQDTNSNSDFDVFIWIKNVGNQAIRNPKDCDVFLKDESTVWAWIPHTDYADGAYPQWTYTIENGSEWSKTNTLKIAINYDSTILSSGEYDVKVLIPNGVSDAYYFSM